MAQRLYWTLDRQFVDGKPVDRLVFDELEPGSHFDGPFTPNGAVVFPITRTGGATAPPAWLLIATAEALSRGPLTGKAAGLSLI